MVFSGDFTPVLAKHTEHLSLVDILSVGVDRMQRNFEPMRKQVEAWKATRLPDDTAKLLIYAAFVRVSWTPRNTWPGAFTIGTSTRRSKSSLRERYGAYPTRSRALSRASSRSLGSGQPRSSRRSSKWQPLA